MSDACKQINTSSFTLFRFLECVELTYNLNEKSDEKCSLWSNLWKHSKRCITNETSRHFVFG